MNNLFLITGMSGSGKSSLINPLREMCNDQFEIWDIDQLIYNLRDNGHPEAPLLKSWKLGDDGNPFVECFNIVYSDASRSQKDVIICGTVFPKDVYAKTKLAFNAIRWIGLYANPDDIRTRLGTRKSDIWTKEMIEFHANSFTWFKKIPDQIDNKMILINTSDHGISDVVKIIHNHLLAELRLLAPKSDAPEPAKSAIPVLPQSDPPAR